MKARILVISLGALLAACGSNPEETLDFDTVSVRKEQKINSDADAPSCRMELKVHEATAKNGEKARIVNTAIEERLFDLTGLPMKQAADSFVCLYTTDYTKNMAPLYREDRGDADKRGWYEYYYSIQTSVRQGRKGVSVYTADIEYYEGGAHGIAERVVMNFDTQSGRLLQLGDVLAPGHEYRLNELLLEALFEKTETRTLDELHDKGYLYSMDVYAPQNFAIGKDGITFIYNVYEIAPYAVGLTELTLSYDTLKPLLKEQ